MIHKDFLYGNIELNGVYEEIVNSSDFSRLKDITQTAMATIDYEELSQETRYEHSIGVYYLMCRTLNVLEKKLSLEGIFISKEEKDMARLAALLHDIGHGVNSHLLEEITGVSHEQRGIDIINDKTTNIHQIISKYYGEEFIAKLVDFMDCIYGKGTISESIGIQKDHTIPLKELLATLISHNIDLDRLDYLMRESTYTGLGTLTNYKELIDSFECILAGNQIILAIPQEKMHLIESNILERSRNYETIYFSDSDFLGNYAFKQLLIELRKHPKEIPEGIPESLRKFLSEENAQLTSKEYMQLTNTPLQDAINQIFSQTKNEKIKYLCNYKQTAKSDYKVLYNGRSEAYIRKLLGKIIPDFPKDSQSVFYQTRTITPYKRTKFGSTNIITSEGIEKFENLPHAVSLKPLQKSILAINPELLRLELGISKVEFDQKYADIVKEIIANQAKPIQEFELKYIIPNKSPNSHSYYDLILYLQEKYGVQDSANYMSTDVYYDSPEDFELLEQGKALRIRDGVTLHNGIATRNYKNRRITYKENVEEAETTYTNRAKQEEIGDSININDYKEFLKSVGIPRKLIPVLEVHNVRRLITVLINNRPIDISLNVAGYQNCIFDMPGAVSTIEIRPRENQILGRLVLLEIQQVIEEAFPELKSMISTANIYEIGVLESYEKYKKGYIISDTGKEFEKEHPKTVEKLNQITQRLKSKKGIGFLANILPLEEYIKQTQFPDIEEI